MRDISILHINVESAVSLIIEKIQNDIIDSAQVSESIINNAVEHSAGDFINSLKEEIAQESVVINQVGELLIETAKYIQSAANTFANVDNAYSSSKF